MEKKTAALVSTVFWVSFTVARALFVGLTMVLTEQFVVNVCLCMMVTSIVLIFGFITTSPIVLWVISILLGAGCSPLFPVAYSLIGKHFAMSGQQTSLIFLFGVMGDSIHTALAGTFMEGNPMIYAYYIGTMSVFFLFFSFSLPFACRKLFREPPEISSDNASKKRESRLGSFMIPPLSTQRRGSSIY